MISLTGTLWGCIVSLDMPGYEEMKSPTKSYKVILSTNKQDLSRPWGPIVRISIMRLSAGWINSIWQGGVVLVVLRGRLEN